MVFGSFAPVPRRRVVVTGIGLVTPVGIGTQRTWEALCAGHSAGRPLREVPYFLPASYLARYDTAGKDGAGKCPSSSSSSSSSAETWREKVLKALPCRVAAPVCEDGTSAQPLFAPTAHEPRSLRFCHSAVQEALYDAELLSPPLAGDTSSTPSPTQDASARAVVQADLDRVGVNIGMGMPSLADITDVAAHLYGDAAKVDYHRVHPLFVPKVLGNMAASVTAIRYGLCGPIGSSVAACATGAQCIAEAAVWVRDGRADVMVCGATEACITPIAIAGFARMRALCTRYNDQPALASRPFDLQRGGFVMGEGAGVLVIESLEHARARGVRRIYGELRGLGVACDAYDVAAPHPHGRGAQRCVEAALHDAGALPPHYVGYVNAHATGTIGDTIELAMLRRVFRGDRVEASDSSATLSTTHSASSSPLYISSTKGAMGHLLGAAGSVEAAVALLALHHRRAPPTVNLTQPCLSPEAQAAAGISLVAGAEPAPLHEACEAVLSTSFGFGGVNTALVFTCV